MTDPDSDLPSASIERWKIDLLQQVHDLAAEFRRIDALGAEGYDGTDGDATKDWLDHLDALSAVRETTERIALSLGIPQPWIERARTIGAEHSPTPPPAPTPDLPPQVSEAKQFYLDMLGVDVWNLQRMAYVAAARELRFTEGTYEFGRDPFSSAEYRHNMDVLHQRIRALAGAAHITPDDAEKLWGAAENAELRQVTAVAVNSWDNLTLESAWRHYTRPTPTPILPPYLATDRSGHLPAHPALTPPTPQQFIDEAAHTLQEHPFQSPIPHWDIEIAIETALPADIDWEWRPQPPPLDTTSTPLPPTTGPEP